MSKLTLEAALQALAAQAAIFQALLLAASAAHKAVRRAHLRTVVRQFAGVPDALSAIALGAVIAAELVAAALLVMPAYRAAGALLATLIWLLYLALIVRAVALDRAVDCGCSFAAGTRSLGMPHVARNSLLALLALGVTAVAVRGGSVPAQASQMLGGLALLALYGAADEVLALRPLRSGAVS
jgi:hypothetical protein